MCAPTCRVARGTGCGQAWSETPNQPHYIVNASRTEPAQLVVVQISKTGTKRLTEPLTAAEFNETVVASLPPAEGAAFQPLTEAQLSRVRELRRTLEATWYALPSGETLEIPFPVRGGSINA